MNEAERKRALIEKLLAEYGEFFHVLGSGAQTGGDGLGFLPGMSRHPSVLELCRCLELLYRVSPSHYQHLKAFYTAETRTVDVQIRSKTKKGKRHTVTVRQRQALIPVWVKRTKVQTAVRFISQNYRGPVYLPKELEFVA